MSEKQIWYLALTGWRNDVESVQVERATAQSVWIDGRRRAVSSGGEEYYRTFGEAKAAVIAAAERRLSLAKVSMDQARSALDKAMKIVGPSK